MKVQNSPVNVGSLDATRTDRVDLKKNNNEKKAGANPEELKAAAKVALSPRAQEMKKIREVAMAVPEVDTEKVARFQKLIDEGKYKVDAKSLADKMVDEHLLLGE